MPQRIRYHENDKVEINLAILPASHNSTILCILSLHVFLITAAAGWTVIKKNAELNVLTWTLLKTIILGYKLI